MESHRANSAFSEHLFEYRSVEERKLALSPVITLIVMIVEIAGGLLTSSIALISDAGHMFTHCFALAISLVAIRIARKPTCHHRTFGLYRAEVLAAFINGLFLLLIVAIMVYEAVLRITQPKEVLGLQMLGVALVGLAVNLASILILQRAPLDHYCRHERFLCPRDARQRSRRHRAAEPNHKNTQLSIEYLWDNRIHYPNSV